MTQGTMKYRNVKRWLKTWTTETNCTFGTYQTWRARMQKISDSVVQLRRTAPVDSHQTWRAEIKKILLAAAKFSACPFPRSSSSCRRAYGRPPYYYHNCGLFSWDGIGLWTFPGTIRGSINANKRILHQVLHNCLEIFPDFCTWIQNVSVDLFLPQYRI